MYILFFVCQDIIPLLRQAPLVKDVCNYRRVRIAIHKISYRDIIYMYIYAVDLLSLLTI